MRGGNDPVPRRACCVAIKAEGEICSLYLSTESSLPSCASHRTTLALQRQSREEQADRRPRRRRPCVDCAAGCRIDAGKCDPDGRNEWRKVWIGEVKSRRCLGGKRIRAVFPSIYAGLHQGVRTRVVVNHVPGAPGCDAGGYSPRCQSDALTDLWLPVGPGILQRTRVNNARRERKQPHQ